MTLFDGLAELDENAVLIAEIEYMIVTIILLAWCITSQNRMMAEVRRKYAGEHVPGEATRSGLHKACIWLENIAMLFGLHVAGSVLLGNIFAGLAIGLIPVYAWLFRERRTVIGILTKFINNFVNIIIPSPTDSISRCSLATRMCQGEFSGRQAGYLARVHITHPPLSLDRLIKACLRSEGEPPRSFLADLFGDERSKYGMAMAVDHSRLNITFFTRVKHATMAIHESTMLLERLRADFPGLDGVIDIAAISPEMINARPRIQEIRFPHSPFKEQLRLIEYFISMASRQAGNGLELVVLFTPLPKQRAAAIRQKIGQESLYDEAMKAEQLKKWYTKAFATRAFLIQASNPQNADMVTQDARALVTSGVPGSQLVRAGPGTWRDILRCNVYPPVTTRGILTPEQCDFTFLHEFSVLPEPASPARIPLGFKIINGLRTGMNVYLDPDHLVMDAVIAGMQGFGKTRLTACLANAVHRVKRGRTGELVINMIKLHQESLYSADIVLKFGDKGLEIPMHVEGAMAENATWELARIIGANLGLYDVFIHIIYDTLRQYKKCFGKCPESMIEFFKALKIRVKANQYAPDVQKNFESAVANRAPKIIEDDALVNTTRVIERLPSWIQALRDGKYVYIDLSPCDEHARHLLTLLILHLLRNTLHREETDELRYLVLIDEAHAVFQPKDNMPVDSHEHLAQVHTEEMIRSILQEDRSRGFGYVFINQQLSTLFPAIHQNTAIKILFNLTRDCAKLGANTEEDLEMITTLKPREAYINNGPQGERCFFYTRDFQPESKNSSAGHSPDHLHMQATSTGM